ncbi:tetratricopeptide repeat protein [Virgisporangium ochraceum]
MPSEPPDPGQARTIDGLVERLRQLKVFAGDPSFETVKDRVNGAWTAAGRPAGELAGKTTLVDAIRLGRRRLNIDLVTAVVEALHPDPGYVAQWRQALRVVAGSGQAASQVRVQENLPSHEDGFTGRDSEQETLRAALSGAADPVAVIAGMAGVGKTRLAVQLGRLLGPFDRVLFVDLRGFHPDQPPAEPAAVLDGFLRLLGLPGQRMPHDLAARSAAYRERLTGQRTLVVLDNAADEKQVLPLLPGSADAVTLVTSRRTLTGLRTAAHVILGVFSPDEAHRVLRGAAPDGPVGADPNAATRIAERCGHLPLALGLIAGHIRAKPGWTLTDHADRLDERHQLRRIDTGVELAFDLSYRHLPPNAQRLLRLLGPHPGQQSDLHAAADLVGTDLAGAANLVGVLRHNHLLLTSAPGRYALHDLVRSYAAGRASDEDPPPDRRAALTRLFDYYLAAAAAALDVMLPGDKDARPRIAPPSTPVPRFDAADAGRRWLDAERPTLVAMAVHAADHGWPDYASLFSRQLFRYLLGSSNSDALVVHGHARDAARRSGDRLAEAAALRHYAVSLSQHGLFEQASENLEAALALFEAAGDIDGQARVLGNLGLMEERLGRPSAIERHKQALTLFQDLGDRGNEARSLLTIGLTEERMGMWPAALERYTRALEVFRAEGDGHGIAAALRDLGGIEVKLGRFDEAEEHLAGALSGFRDLGMKDAVAWTLDWIGGLDAARGRHDEAVKTFEQSLQMHRELSDRHGQAWALNAMGEVMLAAGQPADAVRLHTEAHDLAVEMKASDELARADAGLGRAHHALGDTAEARKRLERALDIFTELSMPDADGVRATLRELG